MFLGLLKNEFIKLFSKKKTYIILFLFIALSVIFVIVNEETENNYLESRSQEYLIQNLEEQIKYQEEYLINLKSNESIPEVDSKLEIESIEMSLNSMKLELNNAKFALENEDNYDWKENVNNQIENMKATRESETDENQIAYYTREILKLQIYLDNDISPDEDFLNIGINYLILNIIIVSTGFLAFGLILFNADSVSNEYNPGTLKFLLIQPVSRVKILLSKFIVMVLSSLGLIIGTQGLFYLGVGIFKGYGNLNRPILIGIKYEFVMENGEKILREISNSGSYVSLSEYILKLIILEIILIMVMVAFIFMISTISKSSVISMTVAIGALLGTNILFMLSNTYRELSYLIFLHFTNLDGIIRGTIVMETNSLNFTYPNVVIASIVTTTIFLGISLIFFKKRDILI